MRARAIVFLATALCVPAGALRPEECLEALLGFNANSLVPLEAYEVPNDRDMESYRLLFAERSLAPGRPESEFDRAASGLRHGDVVGDVGSGLSVAMLQLAGGPPGVHTVAFNAQNVRPLYEQVLTVPERIAAQGAAAIRVYRMAPGRSVSGDWVTSIGGVHTNVLRAMYRATGRPLPEFLHVPVRPGYVVDAEVIRTELAPLARELRARLESPRFELEIGFAERNLEGYRGRMRLLIDAYGGSITGRRGSSCCGATSRRSPPAGKPSFSSTSGASTVGTRSCSATAGGRRSSST